MPSSSLFVHSCAKLKLRVRPISMVSSSFYTTTSFHFYPRLLNLCGQSRTNILLRRLATSCSASSSSAVPRRIKNASLISLPQFYQQSFGYGRFAYDEYASEEEYDREFVSSSKQEKQEGASTVDNVEEWRWKLTMLMRCKDEQEVLSRERKDRRDFEQLSMLATRMGLYSHQYEKVVVFSKVPLPNYRSDLDAKRPQREVMLPFGLQRQVDSHIRTHLSRKHMNTEKSPHDAISKLNADQVHLNGNGFDEHAPPSTQSVIAEGIVRRRSIQMRNKQHDWHESVDGQKMQEFRKTLPSFKERDALLNMVSQNQGVILLVEKALEASTTNMNMVDESIGHFLLQADRP